MLQIDRSGDFRGTIVDYGLKEESTGAVAVVVEAKIDEGWNEETKQWEDWRQYEEHRATGYVYIIKKDGTLNDKQVQALCQHAGWDGDLNSIATNQWQPKPCQFSVGVDEYQGTVRYRLNWINDYERTPGGMGKISEDKLKQLSARFGGPLRALASNAKAPPKPNGAPKPPTPIAPDRETVAASASSDETPF